MVEQSNPEAVDPPAMDSPAVDDRVARRVRVMRGVRLGAVITVLATAAVVAVVSVVGVGPPSEQELRERAGLIGKAELIIAVKDDQPGIGWYDPETKQFTGFDIDIALMVAAELGFRQSEVRFLPIESEDRARMQARDGDHGFVTVDLVVASYSITPEREAGQGVTFSAPYLTTEQSVVTRPDHEPVDALGDLADKKVCTLSTATSEPPADRAKVNLISKKRISTCIDDLRAGEVEAVVTDAAILAGFVHKDPDGLVHHDIGYEPRESYGINVGANAALRDLVNLALYRSLTDPGDRRWENAFDKHLRVEQKASRDQQVAVEEQPDVEKVEVREWPWERRVSVNQAGPVWTG